MSGQLLVCMGTEIFFFPLSEAVERHSSSCVWAEAGNLQMDAGQMHWALAYPDCEVGPFLALTIPTQNKKLVSLQ